MTWNGGKILPYSLAGMMMAGAVGLVGYDIYEAWAEERAEERAEEQAAAEAEAAEKDALERKRAAAVAAMEEVRRNGQAVAPDQAPAVIDFVIFQEIPFGQDGFEEVTVGMRFADSNDRSPSAQWCYLSKPVGAEDTERKISLAVQEGGILIKGDVTPEMAREGATTQEVIKAAQKLCRFM